MDATSLAQLQAIFGEEGDRTLEDIAAETGVDFEQLILTRRALGLATEPGQPIYGPAAEEHAQHLADALAMHIPIATMIDVDRVIARTITVIVAPTREALRTLTETDSEAAALIAEIGVAGAVRELAPEMEWVLGYSFRQRAAELLREEAALLVDPEGEVAVPTMAVGFADLVGFTHLGDRDGPDALSEAAHRLERLAVDACSPSVTVVKFIGDAVMLVSPDAEPLVDTLLDLLDVADQDEVGHPRLRAGAAWGPCISRSGDWYGSPGRHRMWHDQVCGAVQDPRRRPRCEGDAQDHHDDHAPGGGQHDQRVDHHGDDRPPQ